MTHIRLISLHILKIKYAMIWEYSESYTSHIIAYFGGISESCLKFHSTNYIYIRTMYITYCIYTLLITYTYVICIDFTLNITYTYVTCVYFTLHITYTFVICIYTCNKGCTFVICIYICDKSCQNIHITYYIYIGCCILHVQFMSHIDYTCHVGHWLK